MSLDLLAQLTVSGIVVGMTYALLGVSFGVIYATTKIFHLAHAVPYALAAYTAVWASERLGLGLVPACLLGLLVGTVAGLAIEFFAYRPMVGRNATLLSIFLVSLGISVAFPNLLQIVFGPSNKSLPGFDNPTSEWGAVTVSRHDLVTVAVAVVLITVVVLFIDRTRFGRAITAMRTNPTMAAAVGIAKRRHRATPRHSGDCHGAARRSHAGLSGAAGVQAASRARKKGARRIMRASARPKIRCDSVRRPPRQGLRRRGGRHWT